MDLRAVGCRRAVSRGRLIVAVAALTIAGLVGGCGGGGSDDGAAVASTDGDLSPEERAEFEREVDFVECLRDHGIEGVPEPQIGANGFMLIGVPLDPADLEAWMAAQEACHSAPDGEAQGDEAAMGRSDWERVVPGGECQCSDGSEFSFWVRQASAEKVVLYLQDGGACFSAETCDPERDLYHRMVEEGPPGEGGIFDADDARNPFGGHSVVYVPYCTGDVHLGNRSTEYAPGLTVNHRGSINGTAALEHLATVFPDATDVVVVGESAGSVAAPLYGGLVSDRLPDARVTVLADGSGSYPDRPEVSDVLADAWGIADAIPRWPESAGTEIAAWTFPGLFIQSGRHDPDIVFARHDYAYDQRQASWFSLLGIPVGDLLSHMRANETTIEAAGVNLISYVAPGEDHTVFSDGTFYTEEVGGRALVDWVAAVVTGEPVDDVYCVDCEGG